jgi:hypothetical protein
LGGLSALVDSREFLYGELWDWRHADALAADKQFQSELATLGVDGSLICEVAI